MRKAREDEIARNWERRHLWKNVHRGGWVTHMTRSGARLGSYCICVFFFFSLFFGLGIGYRELLDLLLHPNVQCTLPDITALSSASGKEDNLSSVC
jgi:hypothetical protein